MTKNIVFYAPVPATILESASQVPQLSNRVAFGSNKAGLQTMPIGIAVYIHASQPPHQLYKANVVTWSGTLGAIVPAVRTGRRSGKHVDSSVRPPFAELEDTAVLDFWEVLGLHPLERPIQFGRFENIEGGLAFGGRAPEWPVLAILKPSD